MDHNFIQLYKSFYNIHKQGWIKSQRNGFSGIGFTFENLIGKKEESFPLPDYNGIEIKTMRIYSKKVIHLFSIVPDGDYLFPMERLRDILGYPDKEYKEYNILNKDFNCVNYSQIGYYRMAKLKIDRNAKKIILEGRDYLGNNLNINVSWSFDLLRERIYLKLKKLVIIEALSKKIENNEYFYYKNIYYYKLKGFNTFLNLIEEGIITIGIKIGIKKDINHLGEIKSRGACFSIQEKNIEKLYKRIPLSYFEYQLL